MALFLLVCVAATSYGAYKAAKRYGHLFNFRRHPWIFLHIVRGATHHHGHHTGYHYGKGR